MIKVDETDPVGELAPTFPYRDVAIKRGVDMKEFYDLEGEIGRGKFGTVYKCREKGTSLTLAAKFVGIARRQDRKNVEREVEIMRALQHPRLIQLYDAFETDNVMCVILELIEGGELFERVIDDDFILTEKACTVFMRQICEGVAFIHSNNIIHLDLKPENILCLTKTGNRIKIIDFGLARKFEPDKKLQVLFGTPEFVAPEVVNFDQISCATDMWSVGVICYVLLSGLSPFMGNTDVETMANVTVARYDFEDDSFDDISPEAKDFISKLLLKDKEARLTAVECLSHPWLRRQIPPPPPALDTTKDNLKNYVEKYVPYIQTPIFVDKGLLPNKTGLIEQIIENEQKAINSHCLPNGKMDKSSLPILDSVQGHNLLNTEHPIINSFNQQFKNEKDNFSSKSIGIKSAQNSDNVQENNIKNINLPSNNILPQLILENLGPKNDTTLLNRISAAVNDNNERINNKEGQSVISPLKYTASCIVEKTLDSTDKISKSNNSSNFVKINNPINIKQDISSLISDAVNVIKNEPKDLKVIDTMNNELTKDILDFTHKVGQKGAEIQSNREDKEAQTRIFSRNYLQTKVQEESSATFANKTNISPSIVVPSISSQAASHSSSDFSFLNIKKDESFGKSTLQEKSFIPEFMRSRILKKAVNECIASNTTFNDQCLKETMKENDPQIFKQHLRSTPPWFSELSSQNSKNSSGDRSDRRSSDFSCFLNSKEDSESLNLADEIRKLSARLIQMSNSQPPNQNQQFGTMNSNATPSWSRNDPISCFLENHGIPHPRPKFKFSNLNRDVPIGSPPPPSNVAYYLKIATSKEKKDSLSAPQSPRSSPEKTSEASNTNISYTSNKSEMFYTNEKIKQESMSSKTLLEQVHINKTNKKLNFPV